MPFCCHCGSGVKADDGFCGTCGARQPVDVPPPPSPPSRDFLNRTSPRKAALLCYIPLFGWIMAIIVLASARFRDNVRVRFHAFQGIYIFVTWLIVDKVLGPLFMVGPGFPMYREVTSLLKAAIIGAWIFMLIKTSHAEDFKLPLLGDLAEKSVSEQRVI